MVAVVAVVLFLLGLGSVQGNRISAGFKDIQHFYASRRHALDDFKKVEHCVGRNDVAGLQMAHPTPSSLLPSLSRWQ